MSGRFARGAKSNCANPVFEKWLTEWRDDAAARELQSRFIYNKVSSWRFGFTTDSNLYFVSSVLHRSESIHCQFRRAKSVLYLKDSVTRYVK